MAETVKSRRERFEALLTGIFWLLAVGMFAMFLYYSMGMTWENGPNLADEFVYFKPDSLLNNVWWTAVSLAAALTICTLFKKYGSRISMDIVSAAVCLLALSASIWWVGASNTSPQSDQYKLCILASEFEAGDLSSLQPGAYAARHSHQLGLVTILRIFYCLFGDGNYRSFQYFSAWMVPVIIFSGDGILKVITKGSRQARLCYLVSMVLCVPLYLYVPFVYGELCSTALAMVSAWMILECLTRFSWIRWLVLTGAMGLAVMARQNTLIFAIGFLLVIIIKLFGRFKWQTAVLGLGIMAGIGAGRLAVHGIYGPLTPAESKPLPYILYVAMGTMDGDRPGWYNDYHQSVYRSSGWDPKKAGDQGYRDLQAFLEQCRNDPDYAIDFYYRKINTQWNVPMYQSLAMNSQAAGPQSRLAEKVYTGRLRHWLEQWMNIYQILVYGGVLFLLAEKRRQWTTIENYILLICVFGGFLFSLMWEAKTRYVFPYFIAMIPYGAAGVWALLEVLDRKIRKTHKGKIPHGRA